jgi:hypothetical protein
LPRRGKAVAPARKSQKTNDKVQESSKLNKESSKASFEAFFFELGASL